MQPPYLTENEIADICKPLVQPAAMTRHLKSLGFHVKPRPDGRPLVSRDNYNAVMMGHTPSGSITSPGAEPNVGALLDRLKNKEASCDHGKTEKKQPARVT